MHRGRNVVALLGLLLLMAGRFTLAAEKPSAPTSEAKSYLASKCVEHGYDAPSGDGLKYWIYIPDRLRRGTTAPVVVFLHGFGNENPHLYYYHLRHLCLQGNLVIFPQFLASSLGGRVADRWWDADQRKFLHRAVTSVEQALGELGKWGIASEEITLYGHSVGGLLALAWSQHSFIPDRLVLANPAITTPDFVKILAKFTPINWREAAKTVSCPVWILTGEEDTVAPSNQSLAIDDALESSPRHAVYLARSDYHGVPPLKADHNAPVTAWKNPSTSFSESWRGEQEVNAIATRYYWFALDAAIAGENTVSFNMGVWSDGMPVRSIIRLR